jgi:hypothetical protein
VNGDPRRLGGYGSYGESVFVRDGDVYVAGYENGGDWSRNRAMLWVNGDPQELGGIPSSAYSVFVK